MTKAALVSLAILFLSAREAGAAVFSLTLDAASVGFGLIAPGESRELGVGGYHNELTAVSDGAVPYFIKIYDSAPLTCGLQTVSNANFEWLASYSDGQGTVAAGGYQPFSLSPALVYTAAGTDLTGVPVKIRFRYRLTIPGGQAAGTYTTTIVYLLTETL